MSLMIGMTSFNKFNKFKLNDSSDLNDLIGTRDAVRVKYLVYTSIRFSCCLNKMVLTVVETFCGAGSLHLGFKRNGFRPLLLNDIANKNIIYTTDLLYIKNISPITRIII
jgi:hypothetical protein